MKTRNGDGTRAAAIRAAIVVSGGRVPSWLDDYIDAEETGARHALRSVDAGFTWHGETPPVSEVDISHAASL